MSHPQGVPGVSLQRNQRPLPTAKPKPKRLRTKRERNAAKFGPRAGSGGSRRGPAAAPRWLQPRPWRGPALGSPLRPPRPVVITQHRLCHRGLFQHEVKSLDVRRLLTPGPGGDGPAPEPPETGEGAAGGLPAAALKGLVARLASLLGSFGVFAGRELVGERRRSLLAALRRHRRGPPDLRVFLAHRPPAQPPGQRSPQAPRREARPGPPGRAVSLGGWVVGDPPARTPSPLRAVDMLPPPPHTPSPIFGVPRERENPFSWSSAEGEEDETPGGLTQAWGGAGGLLPDPPPFWRSPQPPQEEEEEEGDEGWTPINPPAFSPDPPPWGSPQPRDTRALPRAPRPPRAPKIWRTEAPWVPPDPSRSPRDAPRPPWDSPDPPRTPPSLLWELPDPARAPSTPPRLSRAAQIWSLEPRQAPPDPLRPLWDPPNPSGPPWDPRPWSPELPRAALQRPRAPCTPQLWNPEPPRAPLDARRPLWDPPRPPWEPPAAPGPLWDSTRPPWEPPAAPGPLWDSPEPPRAPLDPPKSPRTLELWSPEPPWDPPAAPRPSRDPRPWSPDPPGVPQRTEPSRCCCCRRLCRDAPPRDRLCRHTAPRDSPSRNTFHRAPPRHAPLHRDPAPRCPQPPKRCRPGWGGVGLGLGSPRSPPGWGCPCWGGGFHTRRGL